MISMIKVGLKKTDRSPRYFQFFIFNLCLFSPHLTLFHFLLHCFYPKILDQDYFRHCKTLHSTIAWFHPATAKICLYWWKLQYCNHCHFLSWNKNVVKILEHLIWVCKHSNSKFESNYLIFGQFLTYLKIVFCSQIEYLSACTKIVIKFLSLDRKLLGVQYCDFH